MSEQPKLPTEAEKEVEPFDLLAIPKKEVVSLNTLSEEDSAISTEELMNLEFPLNKLKEGLEEFTPDDGQPIDLLEDQAQYIPEATKEAIKPTTLSGIIKSQKATLATLAVLATSLIPTENADATDLASIERLNAIPDATSSLKYQNNTSLRAAIQSGKVPASWVTNVNGKIKIEDPQAKNDNFRQQAVGRLPRTSHFNTSTIDNKNINLRPTDQFEENNYNKPGNYTTLKQHPSNVHIGKGIDPSSFQIDADPTSEVSIGNAPEDN